MVEPVIVCPNCHTEIKLTESLAAPLVEATRKEYESRLAQKEDEVSRREASIRDQEKALEQSRSQLKEAIEEEVRNQRPAIAAEEANRARRLVSDELAGKSRELAALQEILVAKDAKLSEAQKVQAELLRKQRELDEALRAVDLTVEQRVQASLVSVRDKAKRDAEGELKLKVAEREETIAGLQRQIEVLKQKAEQGSQQLQGEVQELELESLLSTKFPMDLLEPVPKGEFGGDIMERVRNSSGQIVGTILWESKRTRNWSEGWLPKLRNDQRAAKAEIAVLVSKTLPKEVDLFELMEGIWVVDPRCAIAIATALRQSLLELATVRQVQEGKHTKMGMVYDYLTGPRFRAHVQCIVEKFTEMEEDLAKEKKTMTRQWAKREEQMREVIISTAGMYGDLQGIAGKNLHEIEGLAMGMLPADVPQG